MSEMTPEETHLYYMLLHDQVDVTIMQNGFAHIQYLSKYPPEIRLATLGMMQNVSERLYETEPECESD